MKNWHSVANREKRKKEKSKERERERDIKNEERKRLPTRKAKTTNHRWT